MGKGSVSSFASREVKTEKARKMKGMRVRSSVGVSFLVLMLVSVWVIPMANGATNPSQCKEERRLLVNACRPIIFGRNPTANCCQLVRVTHVECVCPYVTPKLAAIIGVERTIKQIQGCGRTVPHNFKCGSVTTP